MELVDMEISRYHWAGMRCGCRRSAEHLAGDLRRVAGARTQAEVDEVRLEGHVVQVGAYDPALAVTSVVLAALADDVSPVARACLTDLLLGILSADGQSLELAAEGRDMVFECQEAARRGTWTLYAEIMSGRDIDAANNSFECLVVIDEDEDRLSRIRQLAGTRIGPDL
ncbi:hypothetical protein [Couchioplanes caeruleus]|uniref:Uncharacterized protein n=1 Tax=Couchioplanes caeruleus subsp. caeruleus TaxID=56427 RepID=A0A1K0GG36_9ACTN|nr:hypothetical protein [Couchioplanes caeruleus]OJF09812.1 hypothetical protein BG844_35685 [Couchioplanes caeruleus subsp. caeruleus]